MLSFVFSHFTPNLGEELDMGDIRFLPFYEKLTIRFPGYIAGKVLVSTLLGLAFLAAHYVSIGNKIFEDWSWFLSALISTAVLCLYYATHTLRTILSQMDMRLRPDGGEVKGTLLTSLTKGSGVGADGTLSFGPGPGSL